MKATNLAALYAPWRSRSQSARHGQAGLTLIETIFALAIFAMGSTAMMSAIFYATGSLAGSKKIAIATEIAAARMEQVKASPIVFFAQLDGDAPPSPLCGPDAKCPAWSHASLNQGFGQIPGYPELASWIILQGNLTDNTAVIRIPVVWIKPGGRFSTRTGAAFNPMDPDANPASVELISSVQYR
jgi:prepilin-type N-terminal cleavage/methylation domain-containing protein